MAAARVERRCRRTPSRPAVDQSGFGLIEILITLLLAGLVVLGLAAGLLTLVRSNAATDERQRIDQALGNVGEGLKALPYVPCTPGGGPTAGQVWTAYSDSATTWRPPAGMDVDITDVEYWDRGTREFVDDCVGADVGAQRVTVSASWRGRVGTAHVVLGAR